MKRIISFLLIALLLISICGCDSNKVKLTLDNYTDYLQIHGSTGLTDHIERVSGIDFGQYSEGSHWVETDFFKQVTGHVSAKNLAPNYNYENVLVTVRFYGSVYVIPEDADRDNPVCVEVPVDFEGIFGLTAGGESKGDVATFSSIPSGMMIVPGGKTTGVEYDIDFEVIAISGSAFPS